MREAKDCQRIESEIQRSRRPEDRDHKAHPKQLIEEARKSGICEDGFAFV